MSSKGLKVILSLLLILVVVLQGAFAVPTDAKNIQSFTPKALTAAVVPVTETEPNGTAKLTMTIANLPGDTKDSTLTWYVVIDKKIGTGEWINVEQIPTVTFAQNNSLGNGKYSFVQKWTEDYAWDGSATISYRAAVMLDDLTANRGGKSAYSNIASIGLVGSPWALDELKSAEAAGLIPDILKGQDLTRVITREEFAELALKLYEGVTGNAGQPISPNPFTDTQNPQILKAFKLEITLGTSATTFTPQKQITREECATMLFRTLKKIAPKEDFTVAGVKDFSDQKRISKWALDAAKYMSKIGIVTGNEKGEFMPKAGTAAEAAVKFGMATREQAIVMAYRAFEKFK